MLFFNSKKVNKQIEELNRIAQKVQEIRENLLNESINNVRGNWHGETADLFLKKCDSLTAITEQEIRNIRNLASSLKKSSFALSIAEKAAGFLFK